MVLCSIDTIWKCLTPAGHPNSKSKKKDSLQVWTGCTTLKFSQITLSRTLGIIFDPCGEKEWWEKDNDDHDEFKEGVEMKLGKEGT